MIVKYLLLIVLCINLLEASAATPMQEMDSCLEKATSSVQVSDCTQKSFKSAEQNMKSLSHFQCALSSFELPFNCV